MRKIFITEKVQSFADEAAEVLLKTQNDLGFFNAEEQGIHKVTKERWASAQTYERTTWCVNNPACQDDRNFDHVEKFNSFESIKDKLANKKSIIELGCGPFTNLRLFLNQFKFEQVSLLDPLLNDYLSLEHCPYSSGSLNDTQVTLINSSIEEFDSTNVKFDVVMMINVIEHCYDVNTIFDQINKMLSPDGIFIFADVYFKDVQTLASNLYDAGHPLRLSEPKMDEFLKNFTPIFDQRYHGLFEQEWRNDIYFVGKKT